MAIFYEEVPPSLVEWIPKQKILWVATAPLSPNGHVNVSPKGGPNFFGLIGTKRFWYMDMSGSGNETISHLYEPDNARITIMFLEFEAGPKIVRLFGHGSVLERGTAEFDQMVKDQKITVLPGTRSIIVIDIHQVGSSCGFSVPFFEFKAHRPVLDDFFVAKEKKYKEGKQEESMEHYWAWKNSLSIDRMPGMKAGLDYMKKANVQPLKKFKGPHAPTEYTGRASRAGYGVLHLLVAAVIGALLAFVGMVYGAQMISVIEQTSLSDVEDILRARVSEIAARF